MNTNVKIKKITFIALGVAILAICSWIAIPIGTVPFTMQTFAVSALIIVLGMKDALISLLVYIILGAAGVPIFAGFAGGITPFLAPTGGFLIGFIPMIIVSGMLLKIAGNRRYFKILALEAGTIACYICGVVYTCGLFMGESRDTGFGAILLMTVVPYIIPDIIKNIVAVIAGERILRSLPGTGIENGRG